jgi:hypothetical protein
LTLRLNFRTRFEKRALIIAGVCLISLTTSSPGFAQKPKANSKGAITLAGITLRLPKNYKLAKEQPTPESAVMFGKDKDAIFFLVSNGPTPKDPSAIIKDALKQLFPKQSQQYSWKEVQVPDQLSNFELSRQAAYGYNGTQLVKVTVHNVAIGEKVAVVGEIIEIDRGSEARRVFEGSVETISMGLCHVFVESIFPLTNEKVDTENPPCELIVGAESIKPKP